MKDETHGVPTAEEFIGLWPKMYTTAKGVSENDTKA